MRVFISKFACAWVVVGLLGACATPDWSGMSQSDIAGWKAMDIGSADAQHFKTEGLGPAEVEGWRKAGFKTDQDIFTWREAGFDAEQAAAWKAHGFSAKDAKRWHAKEFTPDNAKAWTQAGMSLDEAVSNRAKGLQPVEADKTAPPAETEPAAEPAEEPELEPEGRSDEDPEGDK